MKNEPVPTKFTTSCRILVADDEHLVATGLASALRELGHQVVAIAADGEAAVEQARRTKPDLAILDIRMPKLNGIDVAAAISRELGVPSLILSAYSDEEHIAKIQSGGLESGVFGYLLKPVSTDELRVMIGTVRHRAAVDGYRVERVEQLENNLANRRTVEQAKWKLVETAVISEPEAHEKLQRTARDRRQPLIEVARYVIEHGSLPQ